MRAAAACCCGGATCASHASRRAPVCQASPSRAPDGGAYYQRYLANRRRTGGELLGPPVYPARWQQQQLQQQQQQQPEQDAAPDAQQQWLLLGPCVPPAAAAAAADAVLEACGGFDPASLQLLLDQCRLATSPGPAGQHRRASDGSDSSSSSSCNALADSPVNNTLQLQRPPQLRQPTQLSDAIAPELSHLVPSIRRRQGVVVKQPLLQQGEPLLLLPPLPPPWQHARASSSSSGRPRVLHVFWDLSSAHPGAADPRVAVAQLRRALGCYGQVAGIYAYGVQKLFNWVPEAFMRQYAPHRLPGPKGRAAAGAAEQQQQQQGRSWLELQLLSGEESQLPPGLQERLGPLRCPGCGRMFRSYLQLHSHMVQRHKQRAPPLSRLLPAGLLQGVLDELGPAAAAGAPAAAAAAGAAAGPPPRASLDNRASSGTATAAWPRGGSRGVPLNSGSRTLGRVNGYYNAAGDLFVPREGRQPSLKYVLAREGVEVRTVQNQARVVGLSLAAGVSTLLGRLLLAPGGDAAGGAQQHVIVLVTGRGAALAGLLRRCQRAGVGTLLVSSRRTSSRGRDGGAAGADAVLMWEALVAGRYIDSVEAEIG